MYPQERSSPDTSHGTAIGLPIKPDPQSTTPTDRQSYSPRRVVSGKGLEHVHGPLVESLLIHGSPHLFQNIYGLLFHASVPITTLIYPDFGDLGKTGATSWYSSVVNTRATTWIIWTIIPFGIGGAIWSTPASRGREGGKQVTQWL